MRRLRPSFRINILKFNQLANKLIREHMVKGTAFNILFSIIIFLIYQAFMEPHNSGFCRYVVNNDLIRK